MEEEENSKGSDHPIHNDQEEEQDFKPASIRLEGKNLVRKYDAGCSLGRLSPITSAPRKNTHHHTSKSTKKKKFVPGEEAFDYMIEQAEFEARHDPYRGLGLMIDENKRNDRHPWKICQLGSSLTAAAATAASEKDDSSDEEVFDYGQNLVQSVCQCSCPSLIRWANEANDKRNRKRKRKRKKSAAAAAESAVAFAGRPEDGEVRCACDYNPFCLATCGGVMNEALTIRLLDFSSEGQPSNDGTEGDDDDGDEVLVLDKEGKTKKNTLYDPSNPKSLYSEATRKKLNDLRKDLLVNVDPIRCYLKRVLEDMTSAIPIAECLRLVQKRHQSLIFVNPLIDNENDDEKQRMRLSVPPGIENLGATCYLNTQLQCLAQNLIFSQGIFSWRPPSTSDKNNEDRMTSVIRLFQQLLLRMNSGPSAVLNTLEFSNALGLDHYEQQDPNEFSRLFFDRLHDSFQQISNTEVGGDGLKGLLPHLFEGISTYETTCLACQATSTRKELFMDMNLPIVDPCDKHTKKLGQQKLEEVFASKMDATVQDCLNSYCSAELLEGDNQYFCSECNCKQDAKRAISFEKLPPVLNIQLSRYVFDRATLMKKKLGNKVLLPLELRVKGKDRVRKGGLIEHLYLLTAVMRHQGASAYSGHYVAEAMDWMTGQWFEFNDEKVSFLGKGPSCSFDPSKKRKGSPPAGSKDAYNMYYVDESFLAQSVVEAIKAQTRTSPDNGTTTVETISIERTAEYSDVAQMCLDDIKVWNQLDRRRLLLLDSMVPRLFSRQATELNDYVWVDGVELRQFLSCKKVLDLDHSTSDDLPLQYHRFRCSHQKQGIHPRLARRGKLVPNEAYNAYLSLLRQELGSSWIPDDRMTPHDVYCGECCSDYRQELAHKIGRAQTLRRLYVALDPKEETFSLHIGALEVLNDESDKYAFIVSRKFITWFRRQVERIMKPAAAIEDTKGKGDMETKKSTCETIAEGLDAMDISLLAQVKSSTEAELGSDDNEKVVNESISCEHGKCVFTSKRSIRYVPWCVWRDIEALFPKSIEHRRSRIGYQQVEEIDDDANIGCPICTNRENSACAKRGNLLQLLNSLEKITRRKVLTHDSAVEKEVEAEAGVLEKYRIIHNDDVDAWNRFITKAKRKLSSKEAELDNETRTSLLPSRNWNVSIIQSFRPDADNATDGVAFLSKVIRPIVCTKHNLPIGSALFIYLVKGSSHRLLNDRLCILKETEYQKMVSTLSKLASEMLDSEDGTAELYDVDRACPTGVEWCHPSFVRNEGSNPRSDPSHVFAMHSKKMSMYFRLDSCVCDDKTCNESFSNWRNAEDAARAEPMDDSDNVSVRDSTQALGSAASDPIPIDCDDDVGRSDLSTSISVKVFEAEKGASMDSILKSLSMSPEPTPKDASFLQRFLRRSTRQRKTRYPCGVILAEDNINIDLKSNIAALRLFLLEQISNGETFELSHALRLVIPVPVDDQLSALPSPLVDVSQLAASTSTSTSHVIDLSLNKSAEVLEDVLRSSLGSEKELNLRFLDVAIVRQSEDDPDAKDIPKDAMMDHMIGLSNTAEIEDSRPQKKRKTRVERGFTGTLLASRSESENDAGKFAKNTSGSTNSDQEQVTGAIKAKPVTESRDSGETDSDDNVEKAKSGQCDLDESPVDQSSNNENTDDVEMEDAYDCKLDKHDDVERANAKPADGHGDTGAMYSTKTDTSSGVDMADAMRLDCSSHDIVDESSKTGHGKQEACHPGKSNYIAELEIDTTEGLQVAPDLFSAPRSPKFGPSKRNAIDWEHQSGPPIIGEKGNSIASATQDENTSHRILMLVQLLLQNPDVKNSDESHCYDAATWAITNDPTMQDDLLLQHAYAKYLDLIQGTQLLM